MSDMTKRVCIFVDGENLRHVIGDLFTRAQFDPRDYLPEQADWTGFFDDLVYRATGGNGERIRAYWYVVQQVDPFPVSALATGRIPRRQVNLALGNRLMCDSLGIESLADLAAKADEIRAFLNRGADTIRARFESFLRAQDRISAAHRSVEFRRSGSIGYNVLSARFGEEKTVDVNLAVDMIMLRDIYDVAVILSGDQDYLPAVSAIKNFGKIVINVAFLTRGGSLLPGGARRLNQATDWSMSVSYEDVRRHLGLPSLEEAEAREH